MDTLKCPICSNEQLTKHTENGTLIDYCEKCGGNWLDKGELNKITHPHDGDIEFCTVIPDTNATPSSLTCPSCGDNVKLEKRYFIEYSKIQIDYCPVCGGIWLNKGDLEQINRELDTLNDIPDSWDHKLMLFLSKLPFN